MLEALQMNSLQQQIGNISRVMDILRQNKNETLEVGLLRQSSSWELACQCRGQGFNPWSRRISHAAKQLGPHAVTTEPTHLEPLLWHKRGHHSEKHVHHEKSSPHSPQLEKLKQVQQWRPAKSLQSCLTLCSTMDCSLPGSSVHGILQVRTLEWVAMPFFREAFPPRERTHVSCVSCIGRQILRHWHHW